MCQCVCCQFSSSHHFSGHRLRRLGFLWFRHRQWRLLSVLFISSLDVSGHRQWRLSFLFCHIPLRKFGRRQWRFFCSILVHCIVSLGTACGNPVFCCSGTASGDPCHLISKVIYGAELEETISNFGTFIGTYICMYITHPQPRTPRKGQPPVCTPAPKVVCI